MPFLKAKKEGDQNNNGLSINQSITYHEYRCFVSATISVFYRGILAALNFGQFDVDLAGGAHAE